MNHTSDRVPPSKSSDPTSSDPTEMQEQIDDLQEEVDAKDREIDLIADIQQSLLPKGVPEIAGVTLAASYLAPERAGGDYYDFLPLVSRTDGTPDPQGPWLIVIADATGHGPGAAVIMTMVHSILHARPQPEDDPGKILAFINDQMAAKNLQQSFVTGLLAVLRPQERTFSFACGGHPYPILKRKDGTVQELALTEEETGPLLGVISQAEFPTRHHRMEAGDLIFLYTDGAVEAMNADQQQFGKKALISTLASPSANPQQAIENVNREIARHRKAESQSDDKTLVAILAE